MSTVTFNPTSAAINNSSLTAAMSNPTPLVINKSNSAITESSPTPSVITKSNTTITKSNTTSSVINKSNSTITESNPTPSVINKSNSTITESNPTSSVINKSNSTITESNPTPSVINKSNSTITEFNPTPPAIIKSNSTITEPNPTPSSSVIIKSNSTITNSYQPPSGVTNSNDLTFSKSNPLCSVGYERFQASFESNPAICSATSNAILPAIFASSSTVFKSIPKGIIRNLTSSSVRTKAFRLTNVSAISYPTLVATMKSISTTTQSNSSISRTDHIASVTKVNQMVSSASTSVSGTIEMSDNRVLIGALVVTMVVVVLAVLTSLICVLYRRRNTRRREESQREMGDIRNEAFGYEIPEVPGVRGETSIQASFNATKASPGNLRYSRNLPEMPADVYYIDPSEVQPRTDSPIRPSPYDSGSQRSSPGEEIQQIGPLHLYPAEDEHLYEELPL